jgi:hypothetical protein
MDHSNVDVKVEQQEKESSFNYRIIEDGESYTVPYRTIKQVTFTDLKKEELIDIPHAARLQYRLMLLDPVIKARIDFTKLRMIVIYNPREADNMREKMSLEELKDFLSKQGVNVSEEHTILEDYDYKRQLYDYAYNPPSIRERAPYGYTKEEWNGKMKAEWQEKMKKGEVEKQEKYKKFREGYLAEYPEMAEVMEPGYKPKESVVIKQTFLGKLFGKKKQTKKEKGFWFHGV